MTQVVEVGQAGEKDIALPIKILSRSYLSTHHLWAANHYVKLAFRIEEAHTGCSKFNIEHRSYVINSVLSSVCFLEASINEIIQDCVDGHEPYIGHLDKAGIEKIEKKEEWGPALESYLFLLGALGCESFAKGAEPYQSAKLLIKLRNELTHYKPRSSAADDNHPVGDCLKQRFEWNRLITTEGNPFFLDRCLGAGCAKWAVRTARCFADQVFQRANIVPNYQRVKFTLGE